MTEQGNNATANDEVIETSEVDVSEQFLAEKAAAVRTLKAIEAALDVSSELKEFENSGSRRVLIDALRDNFLLARSSTAIKLENARTLALESLISRVPDMSEHMLVKVVAVLSNAGEFDLSVITGVTSRKKGPLVKVLPFMGLRQRMAQPDLPKGTNPESNSIKELGSFPEFLEPYQRPFCRNEREKADDVNGGGNNHSVDQIEEIVRTGPPEGVNSSDTFHMIVGHYLGCGWSVERILAHLEQHPYGIGERYLRERRLATEIARSARKYVATALPLSDNGGRSSSRAAKAPQPETPESLSNSLDSAVEISRDAAEQHVPQEPCQESPHEDPEPLDDDPDLLDDEDLDETEDLKPAPDLPPMYAHGDPDPRPLKTWLVKGLIPACGHGLLAGQWGTYKSFVALELTTALMTAQPFLGRMVKRQCGVLFLAAEGADEIRLRLNAAVREKCGDMPRAPFRWYETTPVLLQKGALEKLVAMARQAEASLIAEFGLALGLIIIDTVVVSAGYPQPGAESDTAVTQTVMNVMKELGEQLNCFVLGVDHYGKDVAAGTRGSSAKEASADLVLACLGDREHSGSVTNTRLAVRKCRGGPQGQEFHFTVRKVEDPTPDEDGDPITTLVIEWTTGPTAPPPPKDPWQQCRRGDQQTAVTRLKRVLMAMLAEHGVDRPILPNGPTARMIDREIVRTEFYAQTAADGTPAQKGEFRRKQFNRALDWTEHQKLIGVRELEDVTYIWLSNPRSEDSTPTG